MVRRLRAQCFESAFTLGLASEHRVNTWLSHSYNPGTVEDARGSDRGL